MGNAIEKVTLADREKNQLLFGRAYVELKDCSTQTYRTDDLESFVGYIGSLKGKPDFGQPVFVEADENSVSAYQSMLSKNPRKEKPIAECRLSISKRLSSLVKVNGAWIPADRMEELLKSLRRHTTPEGLNLLDNIMDLSVSKVTKIRKSKKGGNYIYSVTRESAGGDDFVPPKQLVFDVPVFDRLEAHSTFQFDFDFDYKENDGQVALLFKIENLNLDDDLLAARRSIILKEFISKIDGVEAFWGHRCIDVQDDSWKYKELMGA